MFMEDMYKKCFNSRFIKEFYFLGSIKAFFFVSKSVLQCTNSVGSNLIDGRRKNMSAKI
jgi:hypothetical protein